MSDTLGTLYRNAPKLSEGHDLSQVEVLLFAYDFSTGQTYSMTLDQLVVLIQGKMYPS